jgi:precorrin-2 dehydrogenase/sirohydrochlorin ferrochelatase
LNLRGRDVVVIGGGVVATRKVGELLATGARVTVISPTVSPRLARWRREGRLRHRARPYRRGDLEGSRLAVAATSGPEEQTRIVRDAQASSTWLNVVDRPECCDFLAPAVVRRGDLTIAVSTGGRNPALARWLKRRLESSVGREYGRLTSLLAALRVSLRAAGVPPPTRRRMVDRLMEAGLLDYARTNDRREMLRLIRRVTGLATVTLSTRAARNTHDASLSPVVR